MAKKVVNKERNNYLGLSEDKYKLARDLVARNATDAEFGLLIHIANKYKLDPLLKEIWCIKRNRNEPAIIMTSRDGYLAIAHRSGCFDGMQSGTIEDEDGNLIKAWAEVWRKDMSHSFISEVKYNEYRQSSFIWQKYPSAMLIKVAEVFALKRAFSISGMLTTEEVELQRDEPERAIIDAEVAAEQINKPDGNLEQLKVQIMDLGKRLGLKADTTRETVEQKYDLENFDNLSVNQAHDAIKSLKEKIRENS